MLSLGATRSVLVEMGAEKSCIVCLIRPYHKPTQVGENEVIEYCGSIICGVGNSAISDMSAIINGLLNRCDSDKGIILNGESNVISPLFTPFDEQNIG